MRPSLLAVPSCSRHALRGARARASQAFGAELSAPGPHVALRYNMLPPRKIDVVEEEWSAQYSVLKDRYKILVLESDSGGGKSRWSRLRGNRDEIFEVDCAGKRFMDLRGLERPKHKYCLCDGAEPALVLANRKLFEAGPSICTLGESSTGMGSYKVWVSGLRFIITSNNWMELLGKVKSAADREWLNQNTVYHRCTEPLYEQSTVASGSGAA